MSTARYIIGDTRDVTAAMPDNSIDLLLTSPPFLALRSYLPDDHPDKHREIGSEATPADFLDVLLDLTEEWARVLTPHGSIVVELGDTYAGSGGAGGDYNEGGLRDGQGKADGSARRMRPQRVTPDLRRAGDAAEYGRNDGGVPISGGRGWPLDKSLCGIPWLYTMSLAYGRNLLRPERTTDPWRIRNVIAWCRPNPPVGALGDKFRPGTSYMTVACKARDRWFDLDAVRTEAKVQMGRAVAGNNVKGSDDQSHRFAERIDSNPAGAPPLDWWQVSTEPYAGSHYATWPRKLLTRPILAMCPEKVCTTCGQPSRRVVEQTEHDDDGRTRDSERLADYGGERHGDRVAQRTTVGWTDCGHGTWRPGIVLDPFAGSGTTLAVATGHGRDAIGIDIDARNADLAIQRVGPLFIDVETHTNPDNEEAA